ncbi:MAG TPA: secondary thiamine-phosphate synthase enzyme YjbQ [Bradyrhizobium sp.]|nr:secondary thiamine-phosphate synthase enzyme YjbQ [Bradyrhizobium sp.]
MASPKSHARTRPSIVPAGEIVSSVLTVQTRAAGFVDLTRWVVEFLNEVAATEGAVSLFVRHTSASLTVQENADPSVLDDLMTALDRLAPQDAGWTHDTEGPDDMPAHVRTMLTATSLHVPVLDGRMALGTWQAIYLIEHRSRPHRRDVVLQFVGSTR